MSNVDIDGYFYFKNFKDDLYLMISDEDYDIVFDYIKEKEIKNIYIGSIGGGNSGEDLGFLKEIHFFEKIIVNFREKVNLDGLYLQHSLKELTVVGCDQSLELNKFRNLSDLVMTELKAPLNFLDLPGLATFDISNLKNINLEFLNKLVRLETLMINNSRAINSLEGIDSLPLKKLELSYLPKITEFDGLEKLEKLEWLHIENCPNISTYSNLKYLKSLKMLFILKCRQIDSLNFLNDLPEIKKVYIERTKVMDGLIPEYCTVF